MKGLLVEVDHGRPITEPCDFEVTLPPSVLKRFLTPAAPRSLAAGKL